MIRAIVLLALGAASALSAVNGEPAAAFVFGASCVFAAACMALLALTRGQRP